MTLIICEKSSVAKSFAQALHCSWKDEAYRNNSYCITFGVGHMYSLAKPEKYKNVERLNISQLPVIPECYTYVVNANTKNRLISELQLIKQFSNEKIIIATDADREGEIIARELLLMAGIKNDKNIFRFWTSEALTPEVINKELNNMKPLSHYFQLSEQGFARQHADWLVGMNVSTLINLQNKDVFSVGRVQSSLLYVIFRRNQEIENFKPTPFFELNVLISDGLNTVTAILLRDRSNTAFPSLDEIKKIKQEIDNYKDILACTVITETKKIEAPRLFSLTDLSKLASEKFNYSPKKTLELVQSLYEKHKCVSYPRTPSNVMGDDDINLVQEIYDKLISSFRFKTLCDDSKVSIENKRVFDSSKLEAHHALIPLDKLPFSATEEESKIYELILNRFFQNFMQPHIYESKIILFKTNNHTLKCVIKKIKQTGWKDSETEEQKEDPEGNLNFKDINEKKAKITGSEILHKQTKPKKHFTEASLLAFMKNPLSEDEDSTKLVGLGTEATRGDIIEKLFLRNYVEKKAKNIFMTQKGIYLIQNLYNHEKLRTLLDIKQTTLWEKKLNDSPYNFEKEIISYIKEIFNNNIAINKFEGEIICSCPQCTTGKIISEKFSYCCNTGCGIKINKKICNVYISASDVKLLMEGKSTKIKKMKSKDGKIFSAKISGKIINKEFKTEFEFENHKNKKG